MKHLVLLGGGHAHALVLRQWLNTSPPPDTRITLVSPQPLAPYSGMVPGWLAGHYEFEDICIDFTPLCQALGVNFLVTSAASLEPAAQRLHLANGQVVVYDLLSINIGATLHAPSERPLGPHVLALRPLAALKPAWEALQTQLLQRREQRNISGAVRLCVAGGGAAGVESLLAVRARLQALGLPVKAMLVSRADRLLPDFARSAQHRVQALFAREGIPCLLGRDYDDDVAARSDVLLWAAGAQPHAFCAASGLGLSPRGFIRTDDSLRSLSHPNVFAVGDCADALRPWPKAGVFPVRQGPGLALRLAAALSGTQIECYATDRRFLAILATADGSAIASWYGLSAQGRWVWRWKDQLDRAFLKRVAGRTIRA